jgi:hypothetical protein
MTLLHAGNRPRRDIRQPNADRVVVDDLACDITSRPAKVNKDSVLLRFERPHTASDIVSVVLGEKVGDVMTEV